MFTRAIKLGEALQVGKDDSAQPHSVVEPNMISDMTKMNLLRALVTVALIFVPIKGIGSEAIEDTCSARMIAAANERREGRSDPFEGDVSEVVMLHQGVQNLKDRQKDSALCITTGRRFPWLREVWPSKNIFFQISSDGEVDSELIELVEKSGTYAYDRLRIFLGHDLPNTFDILVLNASVPRDSADPFFRALELCLPTLNRGVGAFAINGTAVLCFDHELIGRDNDRLLPDIQRVSLHELFHVAQYQLVAPGSNHDEDDFVENFGPAWLLEGSAQVFQDVRNEFCTERGMQFLISRASKDLTGIGSLVEYEQFRALQDEAYDVSHYAACLLALNRGIEGIVEFYKILGEGKRWRIAFQAAFGVDYDAFVELVEAKVSSERKGTP
jgi:hypothetical protein